MKHFTTLLILLTLLCCAMTVCADAGTEVAGEKMITYSKDGFVLSIPERFTEFITVETPTDRDHLFSFFDNASAEVGQTSDDFPEDPGLIFAIDVITEEEYHNLLCYSYYFDVFAKDDRGNYYAILYPDYSYDFYERLSYFSTYINFEISYLNVYPFINDVHPVGYYFMFLDGYESEEKLEILEWLGKNLKNEFIVNNGLTAEKHEKGYVVNNISRLMYEDNIVYTVNNLRPNNVKAEDYLKPFVFDASYKTMAQGYEDYYTPEEREEYNAYNGPYVKLRFPLKIEEHSYTEFTIRGNYIAACTIAPHILDSACSVDKILFEDETLNAGEIINNYLNAVKINSAPSYTGTWVELFDYGNYLEFKEEEEFPFLSAVVTIRDTTWTMKLIGPGYYGYCYYEDGKKVVREWNSDHTAYEETVVYENGRGEFLLLYNGIMKWNEVTEKGPNEYFFKLYSY